MTETDEPTFTFKRVYPPSTTERIRRLRFVSRWVFQYVFDSMQDAEELGAPEGDQYVALMEAIIEEATERRDQYRRPMG